jgi:hypothetical protein
MLKPFFNIVRYPHNRMQQKFVRTGSYMKDTYPSPAPSFVKRIVRKTSDWVFYKIDSFFQGSLQNEKNCYAGLAESAVVDSGYSQVWELNQDLADIAINDMNHSLNWLIPGFVKHYASRLKHELLLYFYMDAIIEDESLNLNFQNSLHIDEATPGKSKIIVIMTELQTRISCKLVSINDWWIRMINKLSLFLKIDDQDKTYYLLGSFAPQGFDNQLDNSIYMTSGPDKFKFNATFSFHKRN